MSRHVAASSAPVDPIIAQLREQRVGAGMTQRRLARASAVTTSTISSMEDGTHAPTLTVLRRVLGAFGFDLMLVPKFNLSPVVSAATDGARRSGCSDAHAPAADHPSAAGATPGGES